MLLHIGQNQKMLKIQKWDSMVYLMKYNLPYRFQTTYCNKERRLVVLYQQC